MTEEGDTLAKVRGLRVGVATDEKEETGVSVVLFPQTGRGAVEVRGGAPGTYHTDGLGLRGAMGRIHALFFSGGSLYGLEAARGIRRLVLDVGGGTPLWGARTPLVSISGAVIFDLPRNRELAVDYEELGYRAALAASAKPVPSGRVGAGRGARVGKLNGSKLAMQGGQGSSARKIPGGYSVGALAILNAVGNVIDPSSGKILAGARASRGKGWATKADLLRRWSHLKELERARGTVLVLVATDAPATRWDLNRMARAGNDAVARCVSPAHMASDGDISFAVTTNRDVPLWPRGEEAPYPGALADLLGFAAEEAVIEAIVRAVARSAPDPR